MKFKCGLNISTSFKTIAREVQLKLLQPAGQRELVDRSSQTYGTVENVAFVTKAIQMSWIACDVCNVWYHSSCEQLSELPNTDKYTCIKCRK